MSGTLVYDDYLSLYNDNQIKSLRFKKSQIQPSSIDLSLSEECYEIKASFLSPTRNVRENLNDLKIQQINLSNKYLFKNVDLIFKRAI